MISYSIPATDIRNRIYIPKYYDPSIDAHLASLEVNYDLITIGELEDEGQLEVSTGHEIGKEAYGTGNIPFVRTSDISNWEIKTAPKQGVSESIYEDYQSKQDVKDGDILLVRDGTYLIGTNCFVTSVDSDLLYQSHILKFRVASGSYLIPELFFLALNSEIVQRQIRSTQFTADIIDTIGRRYRQIAIPIIKDSKKADELRYKVRQALETRVRGKAFIKQAPVLIEQVLKDGQTNALDAFLKLEDEELEKALVSDTVTLEFGGFEATCVPKSSIRNRIYLPKYYDPEIHEELTELSTHCGLMSIGEAVNNGLIELQTGHEPGKLAYGTGDIPFLRTSDFANWELKHNPKQAVSQEIYDEYNGRQDIRPYDILLVRDGTYLVGSSTIVQEGDEKALYCGGLYRIRSMKHEHLPPYLLLGLLNSYVAQ